MKLHYLDNAATTPVRPEAVQAAMEAMTDGWGNPSSRYATGGQAAAALKGWRGEIADSLGCQLGEVFFTSCGTEGDNWAVRGAMELGRHKGKHIITTAIEHAAVLETCRDLEQHRASVTYLKPDKDGRISIEDLKAALRPDTVLVSMMLVNNELGTILPVAEAARAIREAGSPALLHCDAVQGFLKVPFTVRDLKADLVTISGHKIHAPKGVGALYIRKGVHLPPLLTGGGQEEGLRSGTEATSQIAAFAAAVREGRKTLDADISHMKELRAETLRRLTATVEGLVPVGAGEAPHILAVSMPGYKSEVIVRFLSDRGICVSSGSACHKGKPSHVYKALGLRKNVMDGTLRISFSYDTAMEDVDALAEGLQAAQAQLFKSMS